MGANIEKEINKEFRNAHKQYIDRLKKRMEELEIELDRETDPVEYGRNCKELEAVRLELEAAERPLKEGE